VAHQEGASYPRPSSPSGAGASAIGGVAASDGSRGRIASTVPGRGAGRAPRQRSWRCAQTDASSTGRHDAPPPGLSTECGETERTRTALTWADAFGGTDVTRAPRG
jgi:hypothetical protein